MILLVVNLFFVFCFVASATTGDECRDRVVQVDGWISSVVAQIFSIVSKQYETERKAYGRKVVFNATVVRNTLLKTGLTGPVNKIQPFIFQAITSNAPQNTSNELRFPFAASAMVVIYNLPEYDQLTLSVVNVAGIYKGTNVYWNATYIQNANPNVTMPYLKILPLARMDSDGSTGLFTQVLSANNEEFKTKFGTIYDPTFVGEICCNSTKWSNEVIYMYVNQTVGMVGVVASVPYTVGYASLPSLSQFNVNIAKLKVKTNEIKPSIESVQVAMKYYFNNSKPTELLLKLETANDTEAYPLSAFNYLIYNKSYTEVDCCSVMELMGFLDWFLFDFNEQELIQINFVPIIPELKMRIKELVLEQVECGGELMYPKYLASKVVRVVGELNAVEIGIISAVSCLTIATIGFCGFYYYIRKYQSDANRWLIDKRRIKLPESATGPQGLFKLPELRALSIQTLSNSGSKDSKTPVECNQSIQSDSVVSSKNNDQGAIRLMKDRMIVGELDMSTKVFLHKLDCGSPNMWYPSSKRLLTKMKNSTDRNLMSLIGVVVSSETFIVSDYCSKGTLHYVLTTTRYNITDSIKYQLAIDVAQGIRYLHQMGLTHGSLSSLTCYLDSSWTVKVAQWELLPMYMNEKPKMILEMANYNPDVYLDEETLIRLIYMDPTIKRRVDPVVDTYSFGLLLIEIFNRKMPFMNEVEDGTLSYGELFTQKFHRNYNLTPKIKGPPKTVVGMSQVCTGIEKNRPNFQHICGQLKKMIKISTGIVDIIMDTLEQHAEMLEEKVEERTSELKAVTSKMRVLLYEVLPPQIADKLFNGEPVPPEYYECVTIYFSDIVGFTDISARSTPIDVMTFLNDLWIAFDSIIDKFDVYKVDTIGDAYMVASGLPIRNGVNHCKEIAMLALALMSKCARFKIKHMPAESLKIRIGINSGPVTAGVVGFKMPQYCVFGDTVNTASRMESTSEAQKIQVSERTHQLIMSHFAESFIFEFRGDVSVKGKGSMNTYWLLGQKDN